MSNLRRYDSFGKPYFLTSVTHNRQPFLANNEPLLLHLLQKAESDFNIEIVAWTILPDHFHWLIDAHDNNTISSFFYLILIQKSGENRPNLIIPKSPISI